jgi:hypothetical protein
MRTAKEVGLFLHQCYFKILAQSMLLTRALLIAKCRTARRNVCVLHQTQMHCVGGRNMNLVTPNQTETERDDFVQFTNCILHVTLFARSVMPVGSNWSNT